MRHLIKHLNHFFLRNNNLKLFSEQFNAYPNNYLSKLIKYSDTRRKIIYSNPKYELILLRWHPYYESKILVSDFVEKNLDKLPIKIVTGYSAEMQLIVNNIIKNYKLKASPRTYYNLGCLIINKNIGDLLIEKNGVLELKQ